MRAVARAVFLLSLLLAPSALAGCGNGEDSGGSVNVFAAASLTDAFEEMEEVFEADNPGAEVQLNFAGSSTLLTQIQQGAPADVFASADEAKMSTALEEGLVEEPRDFVANELAVVVLQSNPAEIESLEDLAAKDVTLVLAEDGVPVAEYAEEVLEKAEGEYGKGFSGSVMENVASREGDVKAAANRVSLDEADATFVYESDITPDIEDRVQVVEIPPALNVVASYPLAATTGAQDPVLARRWKEFVFSAEGRRILREWGFDPAG